MMGRLGFLHISLCLFVFLSGLHVAEVTGLVKSKSGGAIGREATHTSEKLSARSASQADSNVDDSANSTGSEDTSDADSESHDIKKSTKKAQPKKKSGKKVAPSKAAGQKTMAKKVSSGQNLSGVTDFAGPEPTSFTGARRAGSDNFGSVNHLGVGNDEGTKVSQIVGKKNVRKAGTAGAAVTPPARAAAVTKGNSSSKALAQSASKKRNIVIAIVIIALVILIVAVSVGGFLYMRKTKTKPKDLSNKGDKDGVAKEGETGKAGGEDKLDAGDGKVTPAPILPPGLTPPEEDEKDSKKGRRTHKGPMTQAEMERQGIKMAKDLLETTFDKSDDEGGDDAGKAGEDRKKKTGLKGMIGKAASSFGSKFKSLGGRKH